MSTAKLRARLESATKPDTIARIIDEAVESAPEESKELLLVLHERLKAERARSARWELEAKRLHEELATLFRRRENPGRDALLCRIAEAATSLRAVLGGQSAMQLDYDRVSDTPTLLDQCHAEIMQVYSKHRTGMIMSNHVMTYHGQEVQP